MVHLCPHYFEFQMSRQPLQGGKRTAKLTCTPATSHQPNTNLRGWNDPLLFLWDLVFIPIFPGLRLVLRKNHIHPTAHIMNFPTLHIRLLFRMLIPNQGEFANKKVSLLVRPKYVAYMYIQQPCERRGEAMAFRKIQNL